MPDSPEMISTGKLNKDDKNRLLEIAELTRKADDLGLIRGSGWGEDANRQIIDESEIFDNKGNTLYITLSDTYSYLQNLIAESERPI